MRSPPAGSRARPASTYRLQFHRGFTFARAREIVPYLQRLGVTHCYASPYLLARAGSTHGYDICDHGRLNPEVGSEQDYQGWVAALHEHGLGQIVDFVPNHMGLDPQANVWWHDVLESGICSPFAEYFDIDWDPVKRELHRKILLPILGDQYGRVLERGELQLAYEDGRLVLAYFDRRLPINPRQAPRVLRLGLEELERELTPEDPHLREFLSILTALHNLPAYTESDPARIAERHREKEIARERLARLVERSPRIRQHIEDTILIANGRPGDAASFDVLHDLLEAQPYRLAYWQTASHEINYRRFFDINDLGGVRVELPAVFRGAHRFIATLIGRGCIDGLRIDHSDGLYDPTRYFETLQSLARESLERGSDGPTRDAVLAGHRFYVIAEKILSAGETIPAEWALEGTTGYDFLNDLNGLFVDPAAKRPLRRLYERFTGNEPDFEQVVYRSKKLIMMTSMSSELNVLAHSLDQIAEGNRRSRDFTLNSLRDALTEFVACFPVYRTYVSEAGWTEADRQTIEHAVRVARRRNPAMESAIFDFLRAVLLPVHPAGTQGATGKGPPTYAPQDEAEYHAWLRFTMRLQQYTGPVQAKGIEDTSFYRYNVLVSLNEVGGEPARMGTSVEAFHEANAARHARFPCTMLATATHDTKLGEDTRARIHALSEVPEAWRRELARWVRINAPQRQKVDGDWAPDRRDEYRFYQALLGCWPPDLDRPEPPTTLVERLEEYMTKAIREAKVHTSWLTPHEAYDSAVTSFVRSTLTGAGGARFVPALLPFVRRMARIGLFNSLSQVTLKLASPGVPDFYQGTELWDLSLVDPDNRRPVDFARRMALLDELDPLVPPAAGEAGDEAGADRHEALGQMLASWTDGRLKLYITTAGLRARRAWPGLFVAGDYVPLATDVTVPAGLVAFARHFEGRWLVAAAPRLVSHLIAHDEGAQPIGELWKTSRILLPEGAPQGPWRNLFTGEESRAISYRTESWLFAGDALRRLPVTLLVAGSD
jgi:(1->4)-alpha-D-glucan 1-alpha-D-glucosylmutase